MNQWRWVKGVLALALLAGTAAPVLADRTPTTRVEGARSNGTRIDITVPYLTTGRTAFMSGYVAPFVYASPVADDLRNPGARPAYNLPFYGARMGFGGFNNGAVPKPYLLPSQAR
jgi:hypothetical protein